MFANVSFTIDPAWPGASPATAWIFLGAAAALIVGITVWTYRGARAGSTRRMLVVLGLRLAALAITVLLMLRPSLAFEETTTTDPARVFFLLDGSRSMSVRDELGGDSRFDRARALLDGNAVQAALRRLADEKKIEAVFFQGSDGIKRRDPAAKADGPATDIGRWLEEARREGGGDVPLLAVLLISDGIDTGDAGKTLKNAGEFRKYPIFTFGVGQPNANGQDKDVALDHIAVEPEPIPAKGKFTVKVNVQAPGFEDARVEFSLWIESGKTMNKIAAKEVRLTQPRDNTVVLEGDAPDTDGEIKITVKARQPGRDEVPPGDSLPNNNDISTFAYVSKEGLRILWVEGRHRSFEGVHALRHSLLKDRRFQVVYVVRNKSTGDEDPYRLDKTAYDVIVLADVSAAALGDDAVHKKIRDRVQDKGTGLVMLGGLESFGPGGWANSKLADLFPVGVDRRDQISDKVRMEPTAEGLKYLGRLSDDDARNKEIWEKAFDPLGGAGMSMPGALDPRASVFATGSGAAKGVPVMAGIVRGKGRVLTFTGDNTWEAWRRTPEGIVAYDRFWRQMMLWLAQQENSKEAVFVKLDERRIERPKALGFQVGFRGLDVPDARFTGKIIGPKNEEYPIPIGGAGRGTWTPPGPGEYVFIAQGKGKTPLGQALEGKDSARFLVFDTDREMTRISADHDFLEKISAASDGRSARADERAIVQVLDELHARQSPPQTRVSTWPDWRRHPPTDSIGDQFGTLWRSTVLLALVAYVACLCAEWFLRRRWGLV